MNTHDNIMKEIHTTLFELGFNPSISGFYYLSLALELLIKDETYLTALTKRLYPDIAKYYNKANCTIERCIRTLVDDWEYSERSSAVLTTFNRPHYTNREIIAALHKYLILYIL